MRIWVCVLTLVLSVLGSIVTGPSSRAVADEKYVISAETWSYYQEYLDKIKNGQRPGAYVITEDGYGSYYFWCSETQCMPGATYSQEALNACEREYDTDCVVFAVRDDIRVEYEVVGKVSSATAAPALSPAPPTAKIEVSAEVKSEIDQYLRNTQRTGRVWALAIAHDGSKVGLASCQSTGGGGYFGGGGAGCNLVSGGPQEQASREAILRCGGPTECTLLYEGSQKKASVVVYGPGEVPQADDVGAATAAPALSPAPPTAKIEVSAEVKSEIDQYLRNTQRTGRVWALAIAHDGSQVGLASCQSTGGGGYFGGGGAGCNLVSGGPQEQASREAILRCGGPTECTLLYEGSQKKANVVVYGLGEAPEADEVGAATPPVLPTPPPATKIIVSAAVKSEIDSYLGNTQTAGKAWALAIANDGSDVAFASCPTSGGWSGGRGCEPVKGRPQELASREAVMRCGGPAACILLYEGAQPAGNVEIVTQ